MRVDVRPVYSEAPAREGLEARRIRRGADWDGAVVRVRRRIETGGGVIIPAGVEARVDGWRRGHGVELRTDPCSACGLALRVSIEPRAVVYLGHRLVCGGAE